MERLERPSPLYPANRLSPTTYLGGGAEQPCLSIGSSPPAQLDCSTENIFFFKGLQGEQADRQRFLHQGNGNGGWVEEHAAAAAATTTRRPAVSPVWQLPEKKKSQSPPPPPPLRSDSFAATKVFPYSEGPVGPAKVKGRSLEKSADSQGFLRPQGSTHLHPALAADNAHSRLHPGRLFSLSSNDVRHSHHTKVPPHQRQHSDESAHYLQVRSAPPAKTQSVGSYYRSLQDLPTDVFGHKQLRHSTASAAGFAASASLENGASGGHKRYYGRLPAQGGELQPRPGAKAEKFQWANSSESVYQSCLKAGHKAKYSLPPFQVPYPADNQERRCPQLGNGLQYDRQAAEQPGRSHSPEDVTRKVKGDTGEAKKQLGAAQQGGGPQRLQDPWVPQEDQRISPLKTPLLHSLCQESKTLAERQEVADAAAAAKAGRRSDRYATTLRNEIQQKRAQLQKSRSAATLTCEGAEEDEDAEEEEEGEGWRSKAKTSSGVSSSNAYKDHLKEMQARVLQATSFQRRDLEPPAPRAGNGRVRGRKRLPLAKRTHSFSEPDKMDKVGVELQGGSLGERRKFFETRPAFPRPVLRTGGNGNGDPREMTSVAGGRQATLLEQQQQQQQRLGTFAEYQATWSMKQKKKTSSEAKAQGRFHSAENILDTDGEEKAACVHERSRSSPSADFYTTSVPPPWRDQPSQQGGTGCSSSGKPEGRQQQQEQGDHAPEPAPSTEGPIPGPADHRTKPDAAGSCQHLAPPPQTKGLTPPPRSHIETMPLSSSSSSSSSHAEPQQDGTPSNAFTTHDHFPRPSSTTSADTGGGGGGGGAQNGEERERPALLLPADRARSPSPQFAPLRLTDKPPAAFVQGGSLLGSEDLQPPAGVEPSCPVKKVPVRIVHCESGVERGGGPSYLPQSGHNSSAPSEPPCRLPSGECPATSPFCPYSRPAPEPGPGGALHSREDAKREELARDIMGRDKTLVDILDQSGRRTTMDLMEGLFPTEEQLLEGALQRRRASSSSRVPPSSPRSTDRREDEDISSTSAAASLVPSSSYYSTSAPKAELLIKMKDMQEQLEEQESEDELDVDLASKKQELISSLAAKLEVLREARQSLQEDVEDNEALGRQVEATVQRRCQPNQLDKFRMFVGDLDKVVSLLLSLSGRLARVENALNSLEEEAPPEEKRTLTEKRKLLMRQHEDAKELKENLDRRERLVSSVMEAHLDAENLDDYRHFVKMKSALIIEQRKLEDKIKLGEEQLKCLVDSLPLEQRPRL
ncbi:protein Shroom2-like isoform X3 [Nelusetta ayraudi]